MNAAAAHAVVYDPMFYLDWTYEIEHGVIHDGMRRRGLDVRAHALWPLAIPATAMAAAGASVPPSSPASASQLSSWLRKRRA